MFLDSERIHDYKKFIKLIPASKNIAIVMRCKKKKYDYSYAKELLKLCRRKKFTFLISNHYNIAKAIGADGVHFSNKFNFARKDKTLLTSCSFHKYSDFKRARQLFADLAFISGSHSMIPKALF